MKHRILILLLLVMGGAIINIAVAWGLIWFNTNRFVDWDELTWEGDWPVDVPAAWPAPHAQAYRSEHAGVRVTVIYDDANDRRKTEVLLWQAGFPCRSMAWHTLLEGSAVGRGAEMFQPSGSVWQDGIDLSKVPGHEVFPVWKRWPLRPTWPGFAINTLMYAGILWVFVVAFFIQRRWRRIRRGLCPKCAYNLRGSPLMSAACPECGEASAYQHRGR